MELPCVVLRRPEALDCRVPIYSINSINNSYSINCSNNSYSINSSNPTRRSPASPEALDCRVLIPTEAGCGLRLTPTPGLHNKIPALKIFARGWVAQKSFV